MSIDFDDKSRGSTKGKKEILLAKFWLVTSKHSRIKASASVADFSFDLATESCRFSDIKSCSSVLMRSRFSPK